MRSGDKTFKSSRVFIISGTHPKTEEFIEGSVVNGGAGAQIDYVAMSYERKPSKMILPLMKIVIPAEGRLEWIAQSQITGVPKRLFLDKLTARSCTIEDIKVGMTSYVESAGSIPAIHFQEELDLPLPIELSLPLLYPSMNITILLKNLFSGSIEVSGFWELDIEDEAVQKTLDRKADRYVSPHDRALLKVYERIAVALETANQIGKLQTSSMYGKLAGGELKDE